MQSTATELELGEIMAPETLNITEPCWLTAAGDSDHVVVQRSPLVHDNDEWLDPVSKFIANHGLVLAAQDTTTDSRWMFGRVQTSVYAKAAA